MRLGVYSALHSALPQRCEHQERGFQIAAIPRPQGEQNASRGDEHLDTMPSFFLVK